MFIFAAPFLAFTGFAGYLSDKFSKRSIVVLCKFAEIVIMALGGVGFYVYWPRPASLAFLYVVLFLMGTHSAFFGPGKYGILPEMLREERSAAGQRLHPDVDVPGDHLRHRPWPAAADGRRPAVDRLDGLHRHRRRSARSTALLVRRVPPANPELEVRVVGARPFRRT